jgi:hypothetical protein
VIVENGTHLATVAEIEKWGDKAEALFAEFDEAVEGMLH